MGRDNRLVVYIGDIVLLVERQSGDGGEPSLIKGLWWGSSGGSERWLWSKLKKWRWRQRDKGLLLPRWKNCTYVLRVVKNMFSSNLI